MMKFATERLSACMPAAAELHEAHWAETEGYREQDGFCPDYEQFYQLERNQQFVYFTVRDEEQRLVGHLGFVIHKSRHTSQIEAVEDFFYLKPEARKGMTASGLLRAAVAWLRECGIKNIGMSSKLGHEIDPLLRRAGFVKVAYLYTLEKSHVLQQPVASASASS